MNIEHNSLGFDRTFARASLIGIEVSAEERSCVPCDLNVLSALPDWEFTRFHGLTRPDDEEDSNNQIEADFSHQSKSLHLLIRTDRGLSRFLSPLTLLFDAFLLENLCYADILPVLRFFETTYNIHLKLKMINVGIDIISPDPEELTDLVFRSIWVPEDIEPTEIEDSTLYFGRPDSPVYIQVFEQNTPDPEDEEGDDTFLTACRIEFCANCFGLPQQLISIEHLAGVKWGAVLDPYMSFYHPTPYLMQILGKDESELGLRELHNLMVQQFGMTSSAFFKKCIEKHTQLDAIVKSALEKIRWEGLSDRENFIRSEKT